MENLDAAFQEGELTMWILFHKDTLEIKGRFQSLESVIDAHTRMRQYYDVETRHDLYSLYLIDLLIDMTEDEWRTWKLLGGET